LVQNCRAFRNGKGNRRGLELFAVHLCDRVQFKAAGLGRQKADDKVALFIRGGFGDQLVTIVNLDLAARRRGARNRQRLVDLK
jgi:hypothetical protein